MNRAEKKQEISNIQSLVEANSSVIVIHYQGLNVAQINVLRKNILDAGAHLKVVKNSLTKRAIAETNSNSLESLLSGPTALVASNDAVSVAKLLTKFAKDNSSLALLGGIVDNQFVDPKAILTLSELPSKDELRAKIIGLLNAPATKIVRLLNTPASQVARVIDAYSKK